MAEQIGGSAADRVARIRELMSGFDAARQPPYDPRTALRGLPPQAMAPAPAVPPWYTPPAAVDPFRTLPSMRPAPIPTAPVASEALDAMNRARAALGGAGGAGDTVARTRAVMAAAPTAMGTLGRVGAAAAPGAAAMFLANAINPGERTQAALERGRSDLAGRSGANYAGAFLNNFVTDLVPTAAYEGTGARALVNGIGSFVRGLVGAPAATVAAATPPGGAAPAPAAPTAASVAPAAATPPGGAASAPAAVTTPGRPFAGREWDLVRGLPLHAALPIMQQAVGRATPRAPSGADVNRMYGAQLALRQLQALDANRASMTPAQIQAAEDNAMRAFIGLSGGNAINDVLADRMAQ